MVRSDNAVIDPNFTNDTADRVIKPQAKGMGLIGDQIVGLVEAVKGRLLLVHVGKETSREPHLRPQRPKSEATRGDVGYRSPMTGQ